MRMRKAPRTREHLSLFDDSASPVVADASTAININATGCAARILEAFPRRVVIAQTVVHELERGRLRGRPDADRIAILIGQGLLEIVTLGAVGLEQFERLIVGSAAETLDDGEAATIAYALEVSGIPLIDERKAHRICGERFPDLQVASTIDLFAHPSVKNALGGAGLADAIAQALQSARMRVPAQYIEWVIGVIGSERAAECPSLPRRARQRP